MSDPKSSYGEPVDEPTPVDDVVGRANEGLADAEAARDAPADDAAVHDGVPAEPATSDTPVEPSYADAPATPVEPAPAAYEPEPIVAEPVASEPTAAAPVVEPASEQAASEPAYVEPTYADAPTTAYESPVVTPSEPAYEPIDYAAYETPVVTAAAAAPQPIFVQAPEAPTPRGNRGAAGAIGLLAALAFALLYLAAWVGFAAIDGGVTGENVGTTALDVLVTAAFWVPVVVFFIAFWLLGAIINRGRWGAWVIFGLLVGIASYGGHILGQLFQAPFWMLTASEGATLVEDQLLAPLAIAAFVIGRELTIWFGAWVSARGKRVTEINVEARREYERTLEAGPQLVQQ